MQKRTAKSIAAAQEAKQPSKKKKSTVRRDFNEYFNENVEITSKNRVNRTAVNKKPQNQKDHGNPSTLENKSADKEKSHHPSERNENGQNSLSNEELINMVSEMTAISQVVMNQLKFACKKIHLHRTNSLLGVRDDTVKEEDTPLLTMFEKYHLPLKTKEEVEVLETELENSHIFLKFFVSSKYETIGYTFFY